MMPRLLALVLGWFYEPPLQTAPYGRALSRVAHHRGHFDYFASNLVYIKVPKAASSTVGGIARRVAVATNLSHATDDAWIGADEPGLWANHRHYAHLEADLRSLKTRPFVFTFVRHPASRCISWLSARLEQLDGRSCDAVCAAAKRANGWAATATYAASVEFRDFQLKYICPGKCDEKHRRRLNKKPVYALTPHSAVACARRAYDFVGVVERFDASVALLALELDVALGSVLFLPSKNASLRAPLPGALSAEVDEARAYVATAQFNSSNSLDALLWETSVAHVDHEAAKHAFHVGKFGKMHAAAEAHCARDPRQDCYWGDNGCGVACLDAFAATAAPGIPP